MAEVNRRALKQRLEGLQRAGMTHIAKGEPLEPAVPAAAQLDTETITTERTEVTAAEESMPKKSASGDVDLNVIAQEVAACTQCSELASTRTQTVFGAGNPNARLCFLGEAPGADEDRQGEPFVGRAGKLLTEIIQNGMGIGREDIYILNILKCRPPGNRNPSPVEAGNCRGFLDRQLSLIKPEFLCCLGAVAAQNLLETTESIGKMRGRWFDYNGIRVMCSYHPAYLLRNPPAKKDTWEDIQMLMGAMDLPIPAKV